MAKKTKKLESQEEPKVFDPMADIDNIDPEVLEKARKEMREAMKEKFDQWIEVSEENADDAFLQEAKNDFNTQVEKYQNNTYLLAGHDDGLALKTAEFLKEFNTNYNKWEKGSWRGIIMFDKVINKHIDELREDSTKDFEVDYSTLIFLYNAMGNPSGMGLASARSMAVMENYNEETDAPYEENIPVTYSGILERIFEHVRELAVIDKKLKLYQERVNIAAAGIRFDFKITELEEFKQFHDAWTVENIPTEPEELNQIANS